MSAPAPMPFPAPAITARPRRKLRILSFTSLFPHPGQPVLGVFVENRLRHLVETGETELRVVAPVPWFPSTHPAFGAWAKFAVAPTQEMRGNIPVHHPRYPALPKVGMSVSPTLMYAWVRRLVRRLKAEADFDLIDAHYFYPDGVAAALLAAELGKKLVITARGTDLNLIPQFALPRAQIRWAASRAQAIVTVCEALKAPLLDLGVENSKIHVFRNGVDLTLFRPLDRVAARRSLGLTGPTLLSVGLLIPRKGHHLTIEALSHLPDFTLLIAGSGPLLTALCNEIERLGLAERVRFLGEISHQRLPALYAAADALVLASEREGWANVLLESMACGTPVVATDVWGTREVVNDPAAGILVGERNAAALAQGIRRLFAAPPQRAATRAHAEKFGWEATTQGQLDLFRQVVS